MLQARLLGQCSQLNTNRHDRPYEALVHLVVRGSQVALLGEDWIADHPAPTLAQDDSSCAIVPAHQSSTGNDSRSRGRGLDADHDIANFLPRLNIPIGLDDLVQPIPPVDD